MLDPILMLAAQSTPMGGFQGALSSWSGPALGGVAIAGALRKLVCTAPTWTRC